MKLCLGNVLKSNVRAGRHVCVAVLIQAQPRPAAEERCQAPLRLPALAVGAARCAHLHSCCAGRACSLEITGVKSVLVAATIVLWWSSCAFLD